MSSVDDAKSRRPRVIILAGYLYISNPIYNALRKQLYSFDVVYYFAKDIIGGDINCESDEYKSMSFDGVTCIQVGCTPKWFRSMHSAWHSRTIFRKIKILAYTMLDLKRYREFVVRDMKRLKPDIVLCTSDIFYTSRLIKSIFPNIPFFILQPCYIDLSNRNVKYKPLRTIANLFFRYLFNRQPYFGLELTEASLLVWDEPTFEYYSAKRKDVHMVVNPVHIELHNNRPRDLQIKNSLISNLGLSNRKKTLIIYTGHFETLYGNDFQNRFEKACKDIILSAEKQYNIIIKVHPNAKVRYWREVFGPYIDSSIYFSRDIDKQTLLDIGDITFATNSYSSVEAAIAGLLTINYYPGEKFVGTENFVTMEKNYTCKARSAKEVISFLDALHDKNYFDDCVRNNGIAIRKTFFSSKRRKNINNLLLDAYSKK